MLQYEIMDLRMPLLMTFFGPDCVSRSSLKKWISEILSYLCNLVLCDFLDFVGEVRVWFF